MAPASRPALVGEVTLADGRSAVAVFHLLAERYLDAAYAPEAVAPALRRSRPRRSAASPPSSRRPPSTQPIELDQPWTDCGRPAPRADGRPAGRMHAMRGISAHSNGFHTCRALHLLQMLLGGSMRPAASATSRPFRSRSRRRRSLPATTSGARHAARRAAARLPDRARGSAGRRRRHAAAHRQGVLLGGAARRARPDAHGDRQRLGRRSLSDRHAVPLHGQHGLELGDEHRAARSTC